MGLRANKNGGSSFITVLILLLIACVALGYVSFKYEGVKKDYASCRESIIIDNQQNMCMVDLKRNSLSCGIISGSYKDDSGMKWNFEIRTVIPMNSCDSRFNMTGFQVRSNTEVCRAN